MVCLATKPLRIHAKLSGHLDVSVGKMKSLPRINPDLILRRELFLLFSHGVVFLRQANVRGNLPQTCEATNFAKPLNLKRDRAFEEPPSCCGQVEPFDRRGIFTPIFVVSTTLQLHCCPLYTCHYPIFSANNLVSFFQLLY